MTNELLIITLACLTIVLSVFSTLFLANLVYQEYKAREAARARYEKDPEVDLLADEFYVPNLTVGNLVMFTVLWISPGINLVTVTVSLIYLVYGEVKKVWNNPVIGW